jgi:hypothetical protein
VWFVSQIIPPIPPEINQSYFGYGFYKLGLGSWTYEIDGLLYQGETEWINTLNFCSQPKYPNPTCFSYWFKDGLLFNVAILPTTRNDIASSLVQGVEVNLATGLGLAKLKSIL